MVNTDYKIEALRLLLQEDCLSERYHSLIAYREKLIAGLMALGCRKKSDISSVPDDALAEMGLHDPAMAALFRRFLTIYDPKPQKFREIAGLASDPAEREALEELYHLPGVKYTRASLYFQAGYKTLRAFTETTVEEVLSRTAETIAEKKLSCIVPLPKEVRTHIAVAKAFCGGAPAVPDDPPREK